MRRQVIQKLDEYLLNNKEITQEQREDIIEELYSIYTNLKNTNVHELYFCEGSYFMSRLKGTEQGIIDNTFTEYIGEFTCTNKEMQIIIDNLSKLSIKLK